MPDSALVLLVDDDGAFRRRAAQMLRICGHRCAIATGVEDGLARIEAGPVDLLVVDQHMGDGTAFDLLQRLPARHRLLPTIVVTETPDVDSAVQALQMSVADYVAKPATDLPARCDAALARSQMRRALYQSAVATGATGPPPAPQPRPLALHRLSPRQVDVVALLGEGLSNQQLAERLGISLHTVKNHLKAIFRRLEVGSRLELVSRLRPPGS
jgi:DNA-binding NarL/FixJ family response regulator